MPSADLLLALAAILLLSIFMGWIGANARRIWSDRVSILLALMSVVILLLYGVWLSDNPILARILPVADVIAWGNLQTPAMALLAGVAWSHLHGPRWQKYLLVFSLIAIGLWRMTDPYLGDKPKIGPERWNDGVCVQTSKSTCSAASATMLLKAAGIPATESEMAGLCLTTDWGTTRLGLYRGLKIKTAGTKWTVQPFTGSVADLRNGPLPVVITIRDPGLPTGWRGIGNRHSVIVYGFDGDADSDAGGHVHLGDPFTGYRQSWPLSQFTPAYTGDGIALTPH